MNGLLKTLGGIAPTLATMLGGPLAGVAVKALVSATGIAGTGDQAKDLDSITQLVASGGLTPEAVAAIKKADLEHEARMKELDIDLAKLNAGHEEMLAKMEVDDRDGARRREEIVKDNTPANLAYMIILGFFAASIIQIAFMLGWPERVSQVPNSAWLLIGTLFGYLANEAKQAAAYYFGSTAGSKAKDATIDKALNGQQAE